MEEGIGKEAARTDAFTGHIAGFGTSSGTRIVLGLWDVTPFGPVADAMVETSDGHRTLIAPTDEFAAYVAQTYTFDSVIVEPVERDGWRFSSRSLTASIQPGRRRAVGLAVKAVPKALGNTATWARMTDPVARILMPGVKTYGTAGSGRTEWYAARDAWLIDWADSEWNGENLGELQPVDPPVRFGFASAPRTPTVTALTSYVQIAG